MKDEKLKDIELEKDVIYGLIKHPEVFLENQNLVKEDAFTHPTHKIVFQVFKNNILNSDATDIVTLARRCQKEGLQDKDGVPIFEYLENSLYSAITRDGLLELIRDLHWFAYLRFEWRKCYEAAGLALKSKNSSSKTNVIAQLDEIISTSYLLEDSEYTPRRIYDGLKERIEERGNNPEEIIGYQSPFELYNRRYGGFRTGTATVFVGRGGIGKSSIIHQICHHICEEDKVPVLILDTEMQYELVSDRIYSSQNRVPIHAIETGKWRKNEELVQKVRKSLENIDEEMPCWHVYVGECSTEETKQIILQWYYKNVGKGNPCIIGYDYISCTGEDISKNWNERQILGDKLSSIRKCCMKINAALITAVQANRSAESRNKKSGEVADDTTIIADSDRIQRYAETVISIRPKTPDEISLDEAMDLEEAEQAFEDRDYSNLRFGSHKMFVLKGRTQGEEAPGHTDLVRRRLPNGTFRQDTNYFNMLVDNYFLIERGDLRDVVNFREERFLLDDTHSGDLDPDI